MFKWLQNQSKTAHWISRPYRIGRMASGRTVVVASGGTSRIGQKICRKLIDRGDRVIVIAKNTSRAKFLYGPHAIIVDDLQVIGKGTKIDAHIRLGPGGIYHVGKSFFQRLLQHLRVRQIVLDWSRKETKNTKINNAIGGPHARYNNARHSSSDTGWSKC